MNPLTENIPFDDADADIVPDEPVAVVDGAGLLEKMHAALTRYVVLPSEDAAVAVVLWIAASHGVERFDHATRLCLHSPVKRCGKSRLLEVIAGLAHEPIQTTNISVPALFRVIDAAGDRPPTLLLDEADRLLGSAKKDETSADLIALLNNGFRRGSPTYRCVGPKLTVMPFSTFAFAAVAGIGRLPDTIEDRGINITMRRRLPGESLSKFRLRTDLPRLHDLRDLIAVWVQEAVGDGSEVHVPDELEDRAQDAWEPLLAVADAAGGEWPRLARHAAVRLTSDAADDDGEQSLDQRLLGDVRTVFDDVGETFLPTAVLIDHLRKLEESPWDDFDFSSRRLALRLHKFGVKPGHNKAKTERGYRRSDLNDAFRRYLPSEASEASDTTPEQGELPDG